MKPGRESVVVSSEVGRGHPQYLDSVLEALRRQGVNDFPRHAPRWRLAWFGYRLGARGGPLTAFYNRLRGGPPSPVLLRLLDEGLRRKFRGYPGVVLVDHPLLAHLLGPVCRVAYVHGEIAAPPVSAVPSAWRTFVPLERTAVRLAELGVRRETVCVCGLFVEPGIGERAGAAFADRSERLASDLPLTVGFFTSGAYPRPHLGAIGRAARSCLAAGMRTMVFCGTDSRTAGRLRRAIGDAGSLSFVSERTRAAETARAAELLPGLDVMVAAAHERTGWACGLGLPMFALLPHIGPFARENAAFAAGQGVCLPLDDPAGFGAALTRLRAEGRLSAMAGAGWDRFEVGGAAAAARVLAGG